MYGGKPVQYGITNQMAAVEKPPPNPYGPKHDATIHGSEGKFHIPPGWEVKAGRDGDQCGIRLDHDRVSAVHATLKFDNGQLLVRDEASNNGTYVDDQQLTPGQWAVAPPGSTLRIGPALFSVNVPRPRGT